MKKKSLNAKKLFFAVLLATALVFSVTPSAFADLPSSVYVDDDFNPTTPGWGVDHFARIQDGINAVASGGTVNVAAGTYNEKNILINKSVTILGDPGDSAPGPAVGAPIIDGGGVVADAFDLANGVSNVIIRGFEIRNFAATNFTNGTGVGIQAWVPSTSNITVSDNWFHDVGYGVMAGNDGSCAKYALGTHTNWTVCNNIIERIYSVGVELTDTSNSIIQGNVIHLAPNAINYGPIGIFSWAHISQSNLTVSGNTIDGTMCVFPAVYMYAWDDVALSPNLDNVTITNNTISATGEPYQIYIRNIGNGTVTNVHVNHNSLTNSTKGLKNATTATIDATYNWWGTAVLATIQSKILGNVNFDPYYVDSAMTTLNTTPPSTVYVDDNYSDGKADGHIYGYDAFNKIQDGINAVASGGTVNVAVGTYNETVTLNKPVSIIGAGQDNTIITGSVAMTAPDSTERMVLKDLSVISSDSPYIGDTVYAIRIDASNGNTAPVTLQNVKVRSPLLGNRVYGAGIFITPNGNQVDDLVVDNCTVNDSWTHGIFIKNTVVSNTSIVSNVTLSNSTFDNNGTKGTSQSGWGLYILSPSFGNTVFVNYLTVTNCSFNGSNDKGIYAESLSNAIFTNVTANGNYKEGMDINLKWCAYENLVFNGCTFTGNGITTNSAGLIIKGRNDGTNYGAHPASLVNVDINGGTFSGNGIGISVGNNVTDIEIHNANISGNISAGVINWTDSAIINATNNWWGDPSGPYDNKTLPGIPNYNNPSGLGNAVSSKVDYKPWLTSPACQNNPPVCGSISVTPLLVSKGQQVSASCTFTDDQGDTHTALWDWGDGNTSSGTVDESNGTVTGEHTYSEAGVYQVSLTLTDDEGAYCTCPATESIVVYDPTAGFVTGGGWIYSPSGAYTPEPTLTGKATFGFVAKYQKGANIPSGNTEFQFKAGSLNFKSTSYEWLVVAGNKAKFKGEGTLNGVGGYKFMLTAVDGQYNKGTAPDTFRIKIWKDDVVIYDNMPGYSDDSYDGTVLGGGEIVIHK